MKPSIALLTSLLVAACAAGGDASAGADGEEVSGEEAITAGAGLEAGTVKLYASPGVTPNPQCDLHTRLELTNTRGARAHLEQAVEGACEIAAVPNPRDYRLRLTGTDCGSRSYSGSFRKEGKRHAINITDHRKRTCRDRVPAPVVVEEIVEGSDARIMYSSDASTPFCAAALCPPGTQCNEETRRCEPLDPFCPRALCGPGTQCNEETRSCEPLEPPFCPRALCGPGTHCSEAERRCVPD